MGTPSHITAARHRAMQSKKERERALHLIIARRFVEVEPDRDRKVRWIARKARVDLATAATIAETEDLTTLGLKSEQLILAASAKGSVDFLSIAFLARARRAADAVCRVVSVDEVAVGTGFLISPDLLITNHHVIGSREMAEDLRVQFNYEEGTDGGERPAATFRLAPGRFCVTDGSDELDFTVVALGEQVDGPALHVGASFCRLSGRNDKHALGNFVNVIQHPDGDFKQIVLRENHLLTRPAAEANTKPVLQYTADTLESSSGSPVFNDDWDVVALHHATVNVGDITICGSVRPDVVSEGTRASFIVAALGEVKDSLAHDERQLLEAALME